MKRLDVIFLFLGFLLIPYYFFSSGSLQPSHILLILSFLFYKNKFSIDKDAVYSISFFFFYCLFVNLVYSLIYVNFDFLIFPINLIYDLIIFFLVIDILKNNHKFHDNFVKLIFIVFSIQILVWFLGLGNYAFYPRYNGYFNDPNQMAFFVLCSLSISLSNSKFKFINLLIFILGFFLIFLTQSRSASLGVLFIILALIGLYYPFLKKNFILTLLATSLLILLFINLFWSDLINIIANSENLSRFKEVDVSTQSEDRGFYRVVNYPEYLLFGSGQGFYQRFNSNLEIHSTWIGFLFYYGIIGLFAFIYFISKIFVRLSLYHKLLFLAPLFYSFSTFGARTVVFWLFLAFFYSLRRDTKIVS